MKTILQTLAYASPNCGNFILSITMLEQKLAESGYKTIYAVPQRAGNSDWCKEMQSRTKVYFLPEKNARILPETYSIFKKIYSENDVVIAHSHFELYDMPMTVTAPKNIKIYWHLHDAIEHDYYNSSISRKLLTRIQYSRLFKRVKILSVSNKHGAFISKLGFCNKNITNLPNAINTKYIEKVQNYSDEHIFLMFGWSVYRKGVDLAIKAAEILNNNEFKIAIVGGDELKNYLCSNTTSSHIIALTPEENVNNLYQNSNVFLHISRAEGQSYALLEAIYAGLPVICSDISENRFAKEFRNVFFVTNENPDDIANKINFLSSYVVNDADVEFNRKQIEENYAIDSWCNQLVSLYNIK
ncbi:MAG: glycosyltransferase family 4 protein [Clostridiales bacterium]|nr:glycosyltransferase family 4 protein [Clostridiales bacterium]